MEATKDGWAETRDSAAGLMQHSWHKNPVWCVKIALGSKWSALIIFNRWIKGKERKGNELQLIGDIWTVTWNILSNFIHTMIIGGVLKAIVCWGLIVTASMKYMLISKLCITWPLKSDKTFFYLSNVLVRILWTTTEKAKELWCGRK